MAKRNVVTNSPNALRESRLGFFQFSTLAVNQVESNDEVVKAEQYFAKQKVDPVTWIFDPATRPRIELSTLLRYVRAILVREHEMCHFSDTISTPVGLLILRLQITRHAHLCLWLRSLCIDKNSPGHPYVPNHIEIPIRDWFQRLCKEWPEVASYFPPFLENYGRISALLKAVIYGTEISIGDAIFLWQSCRDLLDSLGLNDGDVSPIGTRLEYALPACPSTELTTLSILEAHATLLELEMLRLLKVGEEVQRAWEAIRLSDRYTAAMDYVRVYLPFEPNQLTTAMALDLALMTPIDPLYHRLWQDEQLWENVHPGWRLKQILEQVAILGPLNRVEDCRDYGCEVCAKLGWPSPTDIASIGEQARVTVQGKAVDVPGVGRINGLAWLHYFVDLHVRACRIRKTYPALFAYRHGYPSGIQRILLGNFSPPMIRYSDTVHLQDYNIRPETLSVLCDYCIGVSIGEQLLVGSDLDDSYRLLKSIYAPVQGAVTEAQFRRWFDQICLKHFGIAAEQIISIR